MLRKAIVVLMVIGITASISACGRKGSPVAPDDADPKYPRTYPAPAPVPNSVK